MTQGDVSQRVTIETVAAAAQVSRQTVTNALRHPERVRPDTLTRVRAEIQRLGYRPSLAAQSLQSQRSGAIGIELNALGPSYHNATMTPFLAALSVESVRHHMHMVTFGSAGDTPTLDAYEQMRQSQVVDAFVIADTHRGDPRPDWLSARGIPFASFGRVWDDPTFTRWVDVDGHDGTALAVEHCRAAGYQRIGYLGWPEGDSAVADGRREGWLHASRRNRGYLLGPQASTPDELASATAAAEPIVAELGRSGAIVCASDVLAVGALHAAQRAGLRPGTDIGIVGFDDSELARMHGLSSIAQPMSAISSHILRLVHESLSGQQPGAEGVLLRPDLTIRASSTP
ncbi:LacI family DNA-binding transcriptional regulator [Nocardioides sp.]|uniref:LacI family DNA-binding transcriptional regulator n=1 Tax=Nocardioides sp. TaxID=35761 RepID=UPI003D0ED241